MEFGSGSAVGQFGNGLESFGKLGNSAGLSSGFGTGGEVSSNGRAGVWRSGKIVPVPGALAVSVVEFCCVVSGGE